MGNIGRPSTGCYTCRARKVKCDETKPNCKRCQVFGRPCPGYEGRSRDVFRNQNSYAKAKVLSRPSVSPESDTSVSIRLPPTVKLNPKTMTISLFFTHWILPKDPDHFYCYRDERGYMQFLPSLVDAKDAPPCLLPALSAAALAHSASLFHQPDLAENAASQYGQGLRLLNLSLRDPKMAKSDGVLATVIVLGMYEMIIGSPTSQGNWDRHHLGRFSLLHVRGMEQFESQQSTELSNIVFGQLLIGCLVHKEPPPPKALFWLACMDPQGYNPYSQLVAFYIKVIDFYARVFKHTSDYSEPTPEIEELTRNLLAEGATLDAILESWASTLRTTFRYSSCENPANSFPVQTHVYGSYIICSILNHYRTYRVSLLQAIISLQKQLSRSGLSTVAIYPSKDICRNKIRTLVSDICASVPWTLGQNGIDDKIKPRSGIAAGALMLLFPLRFVLGIDELSEQEEEWIVKQLDRIGDQLGIRIAKTIAEAKARCVKDDFEMVQGDG